MSLGPWKRHKWPHGDAEEGGRALWWRHGLRAKPDTKMCHVQRQGRAFQTVQIPIRRGLSAGKLGALERNTESLAASQGRGSAVGSAWGSQPRAQPWTIVLWAVGRGYTFASLCKELELHLGVGGRGCLGGLGQRLG